MRPSCPNCATSNHIRNWGRRGWICTACSATGKYDDPVNEIGATQLSPQTPTAGRPPMLKRLISLTRNEDMAVKEFYSAMNEGLYIKCSRCEEWKFNPDCFAIEVKDGRVETLCERCLKSASQSEGRVQINLNLGRSTTVVSKIDLFATFGNTS